MLIIFVYNKKSIVLFTIVFAVFWKGILTEKSNAIHAKSVRSNSTPKTKGNGTTQHAPLLERRTEKAVEKKEVTNNTEKSSEILTPYDLMNQMKRILDSFKHANYSTEILGRTAEYNDIVLFKINSVNAVQIYLRSKTNNIYAEEEPEKKIIFIVHGLTVMGISSLGPLKEEYQLTKLLEYYLSHLNKFDIFLIPLANPDGYITAHRSSLSIGLAGQTMWNKNKAPQADCPGVMLDRNFDVAWNKTQVLSSCSQAYPGPAPFSEAESRAVRDVLHLYGRKIAAYIHVHAGTYTADTMKGDAILYPRGFTDVQTDDDNYIDLKGEIDESIRNASFPVPSVTVDTLNSWYGQVSGTSVDYASTVYGIPYAMEFVMQLYDTNMWVTDKEQMMQYKALTQVWSRIIDVVFNYIWKVSNNGVQDAKL